MQTGFGPFVAVYLTTQKWTQVEIGFVLSIGGIVALLGQMPAGRSSMPRPFRAAGGRPCGRGHRLRRAGLCGMADLSRGDGGCYPACAGELRARPRDRGDQSWPGRSAREGERLGRNARFASLGNGSAAALMGATGYLLSSRAVFMVTFILAIPTLLALSRIRERRLTSRNAMAHVMREVPDQNDQRIPSGASTDAADLCWRRCCCSNSPMPPCCR